PLRRGRGRSGARRIGPLSCPRAARRRLPLLGAGTWIRHREPDVRSVVAPLFHSLLPGYGEASAQAEEGGMRARSWLVSIFVFVLSACSHPTGFRPARTLEAGQLEHGVGLQAATMVVTGGTDALL